MEDETLQDGDWYTQRFSDLYAGDASEIPGHETASPSQRTPLRDCDPVLLGLTQGLAAPDPHTPRRGVRLPACRAEVSIATHAALVAMGDEVEG